MRLSELIKTAQDIEQKHGNIIVLIEGIKICSYYGKPGAVLLTKLTKEQCEQVAEKMSKSKTQPRVYIAL